MFDILIKDILPIFVIMALGYAAGKRGVFTAANAQIFNKLVLTYALPAALFVSIVKADRTMLFDDAKLLIISLVVLVACSSCRTSLPTSSSSTLRARLP